MLVMSAPRVDNSANFVQVDMQYIDFAQESFRNKTYAAGATETLQLWVQEKV